MSTHRAIDACAMLERRCAAFARAAAGSVRRSENARRESLDGIEAAREALGAGLRWSATECGATHLRALQHRLDADRCDAEARRARESAEGHLAEQRAWGRLRRGLERRLERRESLEAMPWPE